MSPKTKVITWVFAVVAAYCASVGFGAYRIVSSEAFPLAEKGVAAYLVYTSSSDANKPLHFKWWSSWYFRNSSSNGVAQFLMCAPSARCYMVVAYVAAGRWHVNVDGHLINVDKWRPPAKSDR
jgi:hypothetical protein